MHDEVTSLSFVFLAPILYQLAFAVLSFCGVALTWDIKVAPRTTQYRNSTVWLLKDP